MDLLANIDAEIERIVQICQRDQAPDGSWRYCLESGSLPDAYMIILLRSLQQDDESLIRKLAERIVAMQEADGYWKWFPDEADGNLSATIEAYYALLYSGYVQARDPQMQRAKQFIRAKGGLAKAGMTTKVMLALTGQYPWPADVLPVEMMLVPRIAPLSFYDLVGYARIHFAPILIASNQTYVLKTARTPDLSDLTLSGVPNDWGEFQLPRLTNMVKHALSQLPLLPPYMHSLALKQAEQFILERIEPDGTLYSYFTSTFLMIFALLSLGYSKTNPVITRAVSGLRAMACAASGYTDVQEATSTVWNTALLCDALQNAGVPSTTPMIQKAGQYILSRQQNTLGDWTWHNPNTLPGGWGFSDSNTRNPDVDDTTAALRAIRRLAKRDATYRQAWDRGRQWVLSMQNGDGGWPAFEKNTNKKILTWLPLDGADTISIDPSAADLTGRTLEYLGSDAGMRLPHPQIRRGVQWLVENQEADGSWYGRWGIAYLYGTWAALTGMIAVGVQPDDPSVQKAVRWLIEIQNRDGSWGESCNSDIRKRYVPLGQGTLAQTAWATDALIAVNAQPTAEIRRGIEFLANNGTAQGWTTTYPTGAGLPGGFYFYYHSYQYIWPLLALGNYRRKYAGETTKPTG